jgi:hypothetical protein
MAIFVKKKEDVCRDRARLAADQKYDPEIEGLRLKFRETKKTIDYSKIMLHKKRKKKFERKMYEHFMETYTLSDDSFIDDKNRNKFGGKLVDAADVLKKALKDMEL